MNYLKLQSLIKFIEINNGIYDKTKLSQLCQLEFNLVKDRSVFYCEDFAIRFSQTKSNNFGNTVISLSNLQKYDCKPFVVCQVTKKSNLLYLGNTTLIRKVSHSSQNLRVDNIKGSINGSDIFKLFMDMENSPKNFEDLFNIHTNILFEENLIRLVESTNNITPSGTKFFVSDKKTLLEAPLRALNFIASAEHTLLKKELDAKVEKYKNEILIAGYVENINTRGRIIEYLIAGDDCELKKTLADDLKKNYNGASCPKMKHDFGDFTKIFDNYFTETDVKTKIMIQSSNPKAYNLDKLLEFLSKEKSVFMFYFVGLEPNKILNQVLVSIFQDELLNSTYLLKHWAGRNSRGVSQFNGKVIQNLILNYTNKIDIESSQKFIQEIVEL